MKVFLQLDDGSRVELQRLSSTETHVVYVVDSQAESAMPSRGSSRQQNPTGLEIHDRQGVSDAGHHHNKPSSVTPAVLAGHCAPAKEADVPTNTPRAPRSATLGFARSSGKGDKIWCTHWIAHGECSFTQQGCRYRHEMPDKPVLQRLGFRNMPYWYRKQSRRQKLQDLSDSRLQCSASRYNTDEHGLSFHSPQPSSAAQSGSASFSSCHPAGATGHGSVASLSRGFNGDSGNLIDLDSCDDASAAHDLQAEEQDDMQTSTRPASGMSRTTVTSPAMMGYHKPVPAMDQDEVASTMSPSAITKSSNAPHGVIGQERYAQVGKRKCHLAHAAA